ncbi:hypothetical protein HaLaN_01822, partial [Haematococcus lacustris]
MGPVCSLT